MDPWNVWWGVRGNGKMWASHKVRERSNEGDKVPRSGCSWVKNLGSWLNDGCPKGWSENNFLIFVTAKRSKNFISTDWTEKEGSKFSWSIPLFKLLWQLKQLCLMKSRVPSSALLGTQMGTTNGNQEPSALYKQSYFTFKLMLVEFWVQVNWFPKSMVNKTL